MGNMRSIRTHKLESMRTMDVHDLDHGVMIFIKLTVKPRIINPVPRGIKDTYKLVPHEEYSWVHTRLVS